ncbi:MAG: DUF952 domain-containing protein [Actinomycetota bacterium]|nr:DUF952 domain-containing protein [Actinomycetota bacterium]
MGLPRFAVVDVETSGLSTRRHHLLQIGLVTVDADGTVVDSWSTLVRLRRPWSRIGPRKVHGITRRSLRGAPRAAEALTELAARLSGAVFTAHNVEFDAAFLERAAGRHGVALDLGPRLCTLQLSRRLDPDRQLTHDLAAVCARYGVTIERHHDARCDAAATAAVLPHLLRDHQVVADDDLVALYWRPRRPAVAGPRPLFHLALGDEWRAAADSGEAYRRSTIGRSLDEEGFIHCSFADQVQATADRFYGDRDDVVLLTIDQAKLRADVRVEAVPGGERFPHLYGPLPVDAVTRVAAVPLGTDGRLDVDALVGAGHTVARQGPATTTT